MNEQPKLNRHLSPINVWALAFGCIIGWGAFMMPGTQFLPTAGTLGTTIAMIIGALMMMVIAFNYSCMVPRYPRSGGEITFAKSCFGSNHALICGWFLALAYMANVPMNCTALGLMTRKLFFGVFQFGKLYQVAGYDIWLGEILLSLTVLSIITFLSIKGIKKAGWLQTTMAFSLATAFLIITISALFSPLTHWSNLSPLWGPAIHSSTSTSVFNFDSQALRGILAIVAVTPWAYVGFDTIPQAAEECNFSMRRTFGIMILAIAFGCAVYVGNNLMTAAASPDWTEFIRQHDWAVGAAVEALMGKTGLVVLGIAIASAILTGILGFLTATSRLILSMARDGYLPAWFAHVHPKYRTPSHALVFCFLVSFFGPFFGRTALGWFVDMSAIGAAIGFAYTCASCFVSLRKTGKSVRFAHSLLAATGTIFSLGFCALLLIPGMPGSLNLPGYILLTLWFVLGLFSWILKKYGSWPTSRSA